MEKHLVYYLNLERQFVFIFAIIMMALMLMTSTFMNKATKEIVHVANEKAKTELFKRTPETKKVNFKLFEGKDGNILVLRTKQS